MPSLFKYKEKQREIYLLSEVCAAGQLEKETLYFRSMFCLSISVFVAFSSSLTTVGK